MALAVSFYPQGPESLWTWSVFHVTGAAVKGECYTSKTNVVSCAASTVPHEMVGDPFSADARRGNPTPFTLMWVFAGAGVLGLVVSLTLDGKQLGARRATP
jgi:hypothetical protein